MVDPGLDDDTVTDVEMRRARPTGPLVSRSHPCAHRLQRLDPERQGNAVAGGANNRDPGRLHRQFRRFLAEREVAVATGGVEADGQKQACVGRRLVARQTGRFHVVAVPIIEHQLDVPDVGKRQSRIVRDGFRRKRELRMVLTEIIYPMTARALTVGDRGQQIGPAAAMLPVAGRAGHLVLTTEGARPVAGRVHVVRVEGVGAERVVGPFVARRARPRSHPLKRGMALGAASVQYCMRGRQLPVRHEVTAAELEVHHQEDPGESTDGCANPDDAVAVGRMDVPRGDRKTRITERSLAALSHGVQ